MAMGEACASESKHVAMVDTNLPDAVHLRLAQLHKEACNIAVKAVGGLCGGRSVTPWSPVSCAPKMTTRQKIFYSMFARFGARRAIRRNSCAIIAQFPDARSIPSRRRPPRPRRVDPRAVTDGRGAVPRRREGERARRVRAPRDECRYVREGDALAPRACGCACALAHRSRCSDRSDAPWQERYR